MCLFQIRKICLFQIRKYIHFKYENLSLSNTKNVSFSNTRMCHFQIRKAYRFQIRKFEIRKCVHFKYENVSLLNTKNVSFSNTRMCHFQIRKTYCVCMYFQIRMLLIFTTNGTPYIIVKKKIKYFDPTIYVNKCKLKIQNVSRTNYIWVKVFTTFTWSILQYLDPYVVRFAIWYHLYLLKNVKNTHEGVLVLV